MMKKLVALLVALMMVLGAVSALAADDFTWYSNNNVCVFGISLREEYPELTDAWYEVLPVDLSQDGVQTFQLVASNKYYLGEVTVTVDGDAVTTEYSYPSLWNYEIYPGQELLAWFTGIEEITPEFLANPTSEMKFGTAISKENDLNGQDAALLFVDNFLTYRVPFNDAGETPIRFWRNHYGLASYLENAKALLEKVEAEYAEKKAEAATTEEAPEAEATEAPEADAQETAEPAAEADADETVDETADETKGD